MLSHKNNTLVFSNTHCNKDINTTFISIHNEGVLTLSTLGYLPKMAMYSTGPSIIFNDTQRVSIEIPDSQPQYDFTKHTWTKEIPHEKAISKLEKTMYPFKEVSQMGNETSLTAISYFIL